MRTVDPDNESTFCECVVKNDLRAILAPKDAIIAELERCEYPEPDVFAVKLALEEALTNAVKHGNRNDPDKTITVRYAITREKAVVVVRDEGAGFLPETVPDCTSAERLPMPNGRGILLMRTYMDKVCYRDRGREVYFMKRRTAPGATVDRQAPAAIRRTIYFSGRVQGVGFRFTTESIASRFAVAGYIRNLPDGRVELVVEGEKQELDRLQRAVEQALQGHIQRVQACDSPASGEFLSFRITR
jgi:serine/threonine-protein kinase RsbW